MDRFFSKDIRGKILRALQINYPYTVGDQLLTDILQDAQYQISPQIVEGHLVYLEDKGYIEVEKVEVKGLGLVRHLARLTPKGVDLLDGNIVSDPGVRLP